MLIVISPFLTGVVFGQTDNQAAGVSCEEASGVPTLKRRKSHPEDSTPPSLSLPSVKDKVSNDKCAGRLKLRFEGLHSFKTVDVMRFFSERGIELPRNQVTETKVLARAAVSTREFLQRHGYMDAQVSAYQDQAPPTITLLVYEGTQSLISEIHFEGNRSFASSELTARMQEYLEPLQPLDKRYDEEKLDYATRRLMDFMRSKGYLRATLGERRAETTEKGLVLTIPVDEGALYRLGDIRIEGAKQFPEEQLRAMLSLQRGDTAKGDSIGKWLYEDVMSIYHEIGFLEFTAELDPTFKTLSDMKDEGVVDFTVYIEEDKRFNILSIMFQGSNLTTELDEALPVQAGDFFNQRLFNESIKRLNEMRIFNQIDQDRDVDLKSDNESELLDIIIKVSDAGSSSSAVKTNLPDRQSQQ